MLMYFLLFWEATALEVGPVAVVVELASMVEQVLKGVAMADIVPLRQSGRGGAGIRNGVGWGF